MATGLNPAMCITPQFASPTSRRGSKVSIYFQQKIPTDGFRGRALSISRRNSTLSLPPIDAQPSPQPQLKTKPKPKPTPKTKTKSQHKKQYRRDSNTTDKEWIYKKIEEMNRDNDPQSAPEHDYPQSLTPEPEVFNEFKIFENGVAVLTEEQKKRSSYRPRYCWCGRCQRMYNMYKANDPSLENWGNYPCHQW